MSLEFHDTIMGRRFYEGTMKDIKRIADALELIAKRLPDPETQKCAGYKACRAEEDGTPAEEPEDTGKIPPTVWDIIGNEYRIPYDLREDSGEMLLGKNETFIILDIDDDGTVTFTKTDPSDTVFDTEDTGCTPYRYLAGGIPTGRYGTRGNRIASIVKPLPEHL